MQIGNNAGRTKNKDGVLRAVGKQGWAAAASLIGYYAMCLPSAAILAFYLRLGLRGLWIGVLLGLATSVALCLFAIALADWRRLVSEARQRLRRERLREQAAYRLLRLEEEAERDIAYNSGVFLISPR